MRGAAAPAALLCAAGAAGQYYTPYTPAPTPKKYCPGFYGYSDDYTALHGYADSYDWLYSRHWSAFIECQNYCGCVNMDGTDTAKSVCDYCCAVRYDVYGDPTCHRITPYSSREPGVSCSYQSCGKSDPDTYPTPTPGTPTEGSAAGAITCFLSPGITFVLVLVHYIKGLCNTGGCGGGCHPMKAWRVSAKDITKSLGMGGMLISLSMSSFSKFMATVTVGSPEGAGAWMQFIFSLLSTLGNVSLLVPMLFPCQKIKKCFGIISKLGVCVGLGSKLFVEIGAAVDLGWESMDLCALMMTLGVYVNMVSGDAGSSVCKHCPHCYPGKADPKNLGPNGVVAPVDVEKAVKETKKRGKQSKKHDDLPDFARKKFPDAAAAYKDSGMLMFGTPDELMKGLKQLIDLLGDDAGSWATPTVRQQLKQWEDSRGAVQLPRRFSHDSDTALLHKDGSACAVDDPDTQRVLAADAEWGVSGNHRNNKGGHNPLLADTPSKDAAFAAPEEVTFSMHPSPLPEEVTSSMHPSPLPEQHQHQRMHQHHRQQNQHYQHQHAHQHQYQQQQQNQHQYQQQHEHSHAPLQYQHHQYQHGPSAGPRELSFDQMGESRSSSGPAAAAGQRHPRMVAPRGRGTTTSNIGRGTTSSNKPPPALPVAEQSSALFPPPGGEPDGGADWVTQTAPDWVCPRCTFRNPAGAAACKMCSGNAGAVGRGSVGSERGPMPIPMP